MMRPQYFKLNPASPYVRDLWFAALGEHAKGKQYYDSSCYHFHGEPTDAFDPTWRSRVKASTPPIGRRYLCFDGVTGCMTMGTQLSDAGFALSSAWTMSYWFKLNGASDYTQVSFKTADSSEYLYVTRFSNYQKITTAGETATNGSIAAPLYKWHHCAVVHDGTDLTLYLDGKLDYTVTPSGSDWQTSTIFRVGGETAGGAIGNVDIADVMIWQRQLTVYELRPLANAADVMINGMLNPMHRPIKYKGDAAPVPTPTARAYYAQQQFVIFGMS